MNKRIKKKRAIMRYYKALSNFHNISLTDDNEMDDIIDIYLELRRATKHILINYPNCRISNKFNSYYTKTNKTRKLLLFPEFVSSFSNY